MIYPIVNFPDRDQRRESQNSIKLAEKKQFRSGREVLVFYPLISKPWLSSSDK